MTEMPESVDAAGIILRLRSKGIQRDEIEKKIGLKHRSLIQVTSERGSKNPSYKLISRLFNYGLAELGRSEMEKFTVNRL